jgi:hypothetical protein
MGAAGVSKRKGFFLEKKKQKTFDRFGFGASGEARPNRFLHLQTRQSTS